MCRIKERKIKRKGGSDGGNAAEKREEKRNTEEKKARKIEKCEGGERGVEGPGKTNKNDRFS